MSEQGRNAPVIESFGLTKRYGDIAAVEGLSLTVERGEIYGFLGLNGAGKTTTIRMLLGLVHPTRGTAHILGSSIARNRGPWEHIGYLVETPHSYPELSVRENLEVIRRLRKHRSSEAVGRIIRQLGLSRYADRPAGTLSLGNAQRLGLAGALLHEPAVLILDEPSNGLDPAGIVEIRELLRTLARDHGVTIFMSSHLLGEVSRLASRIGIIHMGHLLQEISVHDLEKHRTRMLNVDARDREGALAVLTGAGVSARRTTDALLISDAPSIDHPENIASLLVHAGHPPVMLSVEQEDLEAYFLRLIATGGNR